MVEAVFVALVLLCSDGTCRHIKVEGSTVEECRAAAQAIEPEEGETRAIMPCVEVD